MYKYHTELADAWSNMDAHLTFYFHNPSSVAQQLFNKEMVARFDMNKVSNMTIFNAGKILKFEKGKDGSWGVIDENSKESGVLYDADPTKINKILMELLTDEGAGTMITKDK